MHAGGRKAGPLHGEAETRRGRFHSAGMGAAAFPGGLGAGRVARTFQKQGAGLSLEQGVHVTCELSEVGG